MMGTDRQTGQTLCKCGHSDGMHTADWCRMCVGTRVANPCQKYVEMPREEPTSSNGSTPPPAITTTDRVEVTEVCDTPVSEHANQPSREDIASIVRQLRHVLGKAYNDHARADRDCVQSCLRALEDLK